jgi:hypothetical protein
MLHNAKAARHYVARAIDDVVACGWLPFSRPLPTRYSTMHSSPPTPSDGQTPTMILRVRQRTSTQPGGPAVRRRPRGDAVRLGGDRLDALVAFTTHDGLACCRLEGTASYPVQERAMGAPIRRPLLSRASLLRVAGECAALSFSSDGRRLAIAPKAAVGIEVFDTARSARALYLNGAQALVSPLQQC